MLATNPAAENAVGADVKTIPAVAAIGTSPYMLAATPSQVEGADNFSGPHPASARFHASTSAHCPHRSALSLSSIIWRSPRRRA